MVLHCVMAVALCWNTCRHAAFRTDLLPLGLLACPDRKPSAATDVVWLKSSVSKIMITLPATGLALRWVQREQPSHPEIELQHSIDNKIHLSTYGKCLYTTTHYVVLRRGYIDCQQSAALLASDRTRNSNAHPCCATPSHAECHPSLGLRIR